MYPLRVLYFVCLVAIQLIPTSARAQDIFWAAKEGRLELVRALVGADPELVNAADEQGYTALRWAGIRAQSSVAVFLAEAGADPNSLGADGGTPLHGAAHHDDTNMMAALLEAGGDINVSNQWGRVPIHVAARRGALEVATLLLDAGADPNAVTREGWSALNVAYRGGHPELVELLLARGADPNLTDTEGLSPGDIRLERPQSVTLSRRVLDKYVGHYDLGGGYGFDIWRLDDRMRIMDFSPDDLIPVAVDTFYCAQEPWKVVFHRDAEGNVSGMDVDFLRRTVSANKVIDTSAGFAYVGSRACIACHQSGPGNGPAGHWIASRHSRAFHTLTTAQSRGLASANPDYQDMTDPSQETRCLMCHVTAARNPFADFADPRIPQEGTGCEACHGPGSAYMAMDVMTDHDAFVANGGIIPTELTCRGCHRNAAFDFDSMWDRIRHGG